MNSPDNTDPDISLKIIPAPIRMVKIPVYKDNSCDVLYGMMAPLPVTETDTGDDMDYLFSGSTEEEDYIDIQSVLEGDSESMEELQGSSGNPDRLFIFFYTGRHNIFSGHRSSTNSYHSLPTEKVQYPTGFVDYMCEDERFGERFIDENRLSLRLDSVHGLKPLYDSIPVDTTHEYTFKFIYRKKPDVKAIFVFNNKNFVCKQLTYTVGSRGIEGIIEGIFYPVEQFP